MLDTIVGSAGISLSGGQKQRLALARAVYARKELVILDDVFSGLDAETEEQVFSRVLGSKGLFRQMGTTVLLVTHTVSRLSYSDHVVALDQFGHISEQGHFDKLKHSSGYVQDLVAHLGFKSEDESRPKEETALPVLNKLNFSREFDDLGTQAEEMSRQTGDFAVYKYYFASIGWLRTSPFIVSVLLFGIASKMTEFVLTYCEFLKFSSFVICFASWEG
jgi:ATP-binding cassette subfamily C (CFTR/MRP) protein 1